MIEQVKHKHKAPSSRFVQEKEAQCKTYVHNKNMYHHVWM